ncbi:hypothetical protein THAOC_00850, partial [Thalassiosira oceanica]
MPPDPGNVLTHVWSSNQCQKTVGSAQNCSHNQARLDSGFPKATGDHRRLGSKAVAMPIRFLGGGYHRQPSRVTDQLTKSLNPVATISTEDIIANRAETPPRQSLSLGAGAFVPDFAIFGFQSEFVGRRDTITDCDRRGHRASLELRFPASHLLPFVAAALQANCPNIINLLAYAVLWSWVGIMGEFIVTTSIVETQSAGSLKVHVFENDGSGAATDDVLLGTIVTVHPWSTLGGSEHNTVGLAKAIVRKSRWRVVTFQLMSRFAAYGILTSHSYEVQQITDVSLWASTTFGPK